jgi:hypothetical protein
MKYKQEANDINFQEIRQKGRGFDLLLPFVAGGAPPVGCSKNTFYNPYTIRDY